MSDPRPGCEMVLLVQAELDGELDAAQAVQLQAHRSDCAICQSARAEVLRVREMLRGEAPGAAPDAVRARVMTRLGEAWPRPPRQSPWRRFGWQPVAGFGLGAACAAAVALLLLPAPPGLVDQVVASHIRALQPGHLADVASTDQHTVKPWFDGRVDFAPPVKDFAAQGFPLTGGRLDYVGGRPVAALVYRRDKHVIDLFAWPAVSMPRPPQTAVEHGYNLVGWTEGGMTLWAVSDVEANQLGEFVSLWRRAE